MYRFLFSFWPEKGHIYPSLPIALALHAMDHQVAYLVPPEYGDLLRSHGMTVIDFDPRAAWRSRDALPPSSQRRERFRGAFVDGVPTHMAALQSAINEWQPDVLMNDPLAYAPLLVGELEKLPVATFNHNILSWPSENLGPFGFGLPPARTAETRERYAAMKAKAVHFSETIVAGLNELRVQYGLTPWEGLLPVVTASPYLQLIPTVRSFDYNRQDLPPHFHYIGPCLWDPIPELDSEISSWMAAIPPQRPLILVTESTATVDFPGKDILAEKAVEAYRDEPYHVIITLQGEHHLHHDQLPEHIRVRPFLPHTAVLPRASLVVTHSGHGIVAKSLQHGLPLITVPYAAEQPEVAQRVVASGAGIRLNRDALSAEQLRTATATLLASEEYRERAEQIASQMRAHEGPHTAAQLLEQLAQTRAPIVNWPEGNP